MPDDNLYDATLDSAAVEDHEMFISWVRAGFTQEQAMHLLMGYKYTIWYSAIRAVEKDNNG